MRVAPIPENESQRLEYLRDLEVLDTAAEEELDEVTRLAAEVCQVPTALISLVDAHRQWFKSQVGWDATETSRDVAFCSHAILGNGMFVVEDAQKDDRFRDNPLVTGAPFVRFYAGAPLITEDGLALGTLCVVDQKPRQLTQLQTKILTLLAQQVAGNLRLRHASAELAKSHQYAELQAESTRLARSAMDALTKQIAILDGQGTILSVNLAWREFQAENGTDLLASQEGANYLQFCDSIAGANESAGAIAEGIRSVIAGDKPLCKLEYRSEKGTEPQWFRLRATRAPGDGPIRVVVSHQDITDQKRAEERILYEAHHDPLTGLPNRRLFADRVSQCLARQRRDPKSYFSVMFLDLDRFKFVNDSLGPAAGDELLKSVSRRLSRCLRASDSLAVSDGLVARMGDDEFTILLDRIKHALDPQLVAERILAALSDPIDLDGHEFRANASIGIVVIGGDQTYADANEIFRDADTAMYRAKDEGKSRYCLFDPAMHDAAMARLQLETDLQLAIDRCEFFLHYQPIMALGTDKLEGFEALIRWNRGGHLVNPMEFIQAAESSGAIVEIGRWVLGQAIRQLAEWRETNPAAADLKMAVNLSGKQLSDDQLTGFIYDSLMRYSIPAVNLKLELTESILVDSGSAGRQLLDDIKMLGVVIAMDDFGTGYSSLSYLHKLPVDVLKIDRSFIGSVTTRRDVQAVVQSVISLAHNLGMTVVAEGLETAEQVASLRAMGCDFGQGYYFSRPLSADAAAETIAKYSRPIAA